MSAADKPTPRKCARCGKQMGVFAFTLVRNGKPERGYYHPPCFAKAKRDLSASMSHGEKQ